MEQSAEHYLKKDVFERVKRRTGYLLANIITFLFSALWHVCVLSS